MFSVHHSPAATEEKLQNHLCYKIIFLMQHYLTTGPFDVLITKHLFLGQFHILGEYYSFAATESLQRHTSCIIDLTTTKSYDVTSD